MKITDFFEIRTAAEGGEEMGSFTKKYEVQTKKDGFCCTFYCDLGDDYYSICIDGVDSADDALELSKMNARLHFNRCHRCGRWVCDAHYNEGQMMCIRCAPKTKIKF